MSNPESCTEACPSPSQLQLYQTIIFATPVLFAFMLLLMFCLLYFRRHSRAASIHSHIRAQIFAESLFAMPPLEQEGLCAVIRQRLPVIFFNDEFRATYEDLQCAICISDYQTNEKLLQLPVCKHSFHVPCINQWLENNATCPICRLSLNEIKISHVMNANEVDDVLCEGMDATRSWEERVTSEVYDSSVQGRSAASVEESSQHTVLSEHEISCTVSEHIVNIERS